MRFKYFDRSGYVGTTTEPGVVGKIAGVDLYDNKLWLDFDLSSTTGNGFPIQQSIVAEFLREFGVEKPVDLVGKSVYLHASGVISAKPKTHCLTFTEFKAMINSVDETKWGAAHVIAGDKLHVVDLAYLSGLPACDNRFHGKQDATPSRIELVVVDAR